MFNNPPFLSKSTRIGGQLKLIGGSRKLNTRMCRQLFPVINGEHCVLVVHEIPNGTDITNNIFGGWQNFTTSRKTHCLSVLLNRSMRFFCRLSA